MSKPKKPTQFYATVSTSIVLILISLFLLIFFHSSNITNIVKENINILVELNDNLPTTEIENIQNVIKKQPGVIAKSVEFVSKEEAMKIMKKEMNLPEELDENPFKSLIKFNLSQEVYNETYINKLKEVIELEKGVIGLYHENESIDLLKTNLQKLSFGILVLSGLFIFLALAIIFNTLRLTLYSDIKQIKTMQMVGAEVGFIKKPYLRDAFFLSLKATIAVILFVGIVVSYLIKSQSIFSEVIQWKYVLLTVAISFGLALVLQLFSTNAIINKFLKTVNQ